MPVLIPIGGEPNGDLGALADEVILRTENRVTDINRAYVWVRDALLEISGNTDYKDEFDNLEVLGPPFVLTPGLQEYPFVNLLQAGDYNLSTLDIMIWVDPPNNIKRKKLNPTHYQDADKYLQSASLPSDWYRFGDNVGFNPMPAKAYQVQARILKRHPLNDDSLKTTSILLPREWNEVIIWAAVIRGFMELLEYEKAGAVRSLLYGDPKYPGKQGIIEAVKKRRKREQFRQTVGLRPRVSFYGAR